MNNIHVEDAETLGRKGAIFIAGQILARPEGVIGLATGSTPVGVYRELARLYESGWLDFSRLITFNLDEYCGLSGSDENSYRRFMDEHLFDHVNIRKDNTHVPDGMAEDLQAECDRYERLIADAGGIDLQLLGIGHDGHIGFNEPGAHFPAGTHVAELTELTIEANTRFFDRSEQVPRRALTMGIGTIMKARRILLLASGSDKKEILQRALYGPITPEVPASVLQLHPDVTVISGV